VPLAQLATIHYERGPDMIKTDDTFLVGYVLFDKRANYAEVDAVQQAREYLAQRIATGAVRLPAGVAYTFTGTYENHTRAQKKLAVVIPVALLVIFLILYLQFKDVTISVLVFSTIPFVAAGGFILLWLYGQSWFLDFSAFGVNMRALFHVHPINMSIAIWVGFIALFGIASDDGVVIATYLDELFAGKQRMSVAEIRATTLLGGKRRIRACMMTTATTVLALLPVLTSSGRGADIMLPMAIPSFGGMLVEMFTSLIVPVLYCAVKERRLCRTT
jgi:Cu(I)/Ag(I) efflux system membrane protein CusA/SilA